MLLKRNAFTCDWKESDLLKENIPMSVELSFDTPPVTPGRTELSKELHDIEMIVENLTNSSTEDKIEEMFSEEFIHIKRELASSNKFPLLDPFELKNNHIEKSITKQGNADVNSFEVQPKISGDVQKTSVNFTIFSSVDERCNNKKSRQLPTDTNNIMDIIENCDILFDDTLCSKSDLNTQCEIESKQDKNSVTQLDDTANHVEQIGSQVLLEATQSTIDSSIMSLVETNNSILNTSESDLNIDAILEDIFNDENIQLKNELTMINETG